MSLRVSVLLAVVLLLAASFVALGTLTTHLASTEEIVLLRPPQTPPSGRNASASPVVTMQQIQTAPRNFEPRFVAILAAIAVVTLVAATLLVNRILAPVQTLTAAVRRISNGAYDTRVPERGRDELATLARSFNDLANRLQRSEESRRALIADIAHELRTPLTNVRGSIESLQDGVIAASPEELRALHDDAMLLERLIGDLHELSLGDAGMLALVREDVDLAGEIRAAVAPAGSRVVFRAEADLPVVACDPGRIRQVFGNVLANALKYAPDGVPIDVTVERDGGDVKVRVADSGPGFPPDQAEAIFDRFYRVDDSRSRDTGGTGLGLSIARQLIEAHGGRIGAFINDGGGATVWFSLPATK